eukprot:1158308-Pelagomonas_calceolata.AAC.3
MQQRVEGGVQSRLTAGSQLGVSGSMQHGLLGLRWVCTNTVAAAAAVVADQQGGQEDCWGCNTAGTPRACLACFCGACNSSPAPPPSCADTQGLLVGEHTPHNLVHARPCDLRTQACCTHPPSIQCQKLSSLALGVQGKPQPGSCLLLQRVSGRSKGPHGARSAAATPPPGYSAAPDYKPIVATNEHSVPTTLIGSRWVHSHFDDKAASSSVFTLDFLAIKAAGNVSLSKQSPAMPSFQSSLLCLPVKAVCCAFLSGQPAMPSSHSRLP